MGEEAQKQAQTMIRSAPPDVPGYAPPEDVMQAEGRRRLAHTFQTGELVWLLGERFEPMMPAWDMDILRQGSNGRWMRQRYRFDAQAEVLHFLGEDALDDAGFRAARRRGTRFPLS